MSKEHPSRLKSCRACLCFFFMELHKHRLMECWYPPNSLCLAQAKYCRELLFSNTLLSVPYKIFFTLPSSCFPRDIFEYTQFFNSNTVQKSRKFKLLNYFSLWSGFLLTIATSESIIFIDLKSFQSLVTIFSFLRLMRFHVGLVDGLLISKQKKMMNNFFR